MDIPREPSQLENGFLYVVLPCLTFAAVKRLGAEVDTAVAAGLFAEVAVLLAKHTEIVQEAYDQLPDRKTAVDTAADFTTLVVLVGGVGMLSYGFGGDFESSAILGAIAGAVTVYTFCTRHEGTNPNHWQQSQVLSLGYGKLQDFADDVKAHEVALSDLRAEKKLEKKGELIRTCREEVSQLARVIGAEKQETPRSQTEQLAKADLSRRIAALSDHLRQEDDAWKNQMLEVSFGEGGWTTFDAGGGGNCFPYSVAIQEDAKLGDLIRRAQNCKVEEQEGIAQEFCERLQLISKSHPCLKERAEEAMKNNGGFSHWVTVAKFVVLDDANIRIRTRLFDWAVANRASIEEATRQTICNLWEIDAEVKAKVSEVVNDDALCDEALKDASKWPEKAVDVILDRIKWWEAGKASWFDDSTLTLYCLERKVQIAVFNNPKFVDGKLVPTYYRSAEDQSDNELPNLPVVYVWFTGNHYRPVFKLPPNLGN